jgi:Tfp pilus assembly protein PilF
MSVGAHAGTAAHVPFLLQRAMTLHQAGDLAQARRHYEDILRIQPGHFGALQLSGLVAAQCGDPAQAVYFYERAIAVDPGQALLHCNMAAALCALGRWPAALASCDRALALRPSFAEALCIRGNAETALDRWDAALRSYAQAIAAQPDYPEALCNLGNVYRELGQLDAAIDCYDRAIEMHPDFAEGYFARSIALLLAGHYERGWRDYEWRWTRKSGPNARELRPLAAPLWLGKETLAGKTILLHAEQGLGDSLQYCRYVGAVAALGARVILEVHEPLMRLLAGLPGVSRLVAKGSDLPDFDYHCPLMSLPLALGAADPIPAPLRLRVPPAAAERWRSRLRPDRPRVGLAFSGSTIHPNDRHRSIPLADWIPHLPKDLQYVALQREIRTPDREVLRDHPQIMCCADELEDFAATAALCESLDLVVCVDTSVAHLSGSMGVKTWVLLPFNPDWRWLLARRDSPWYPSVTLYRQRRIGAWREVLAQVGADLGALRGAGRGA